MLLPKVMPRAYTLQLADSRYSGTAIGMPRPSAPVVSTMALPRFGIWSWGGQCRTRRTRTTEPEKHGREMLLPHVDSRVLLVGNG
jgi:hypothetical protein